MSWQGLDFKIKLIVRRDNLDINKFDKYDNINEIDYILNDKSCKLYTLDKETETIIFEFEADPDDTCWSNSISKIRLDNKLSLDTNIYLVIYTRHNSTSVNWGYINIYDNDNKKRINFESMFDKEDVIGLNLKVMKQ